MIQRAASIGVSVNDTIRLIAIAAAAVRPNDDMKRPTMPPMKPTGMKTGEQRQRRRHDRQADLARALDRRLERRHALLLDEPVDVLEHDDRVVDDDADHQRQREHRHLVQREAERGDHARTRR